MILSLSLSQSHSRSQSFGNAEPPVENKDRQFVTIRKITILSLTSSSDVTSLSSCLLKKDLGLLKGRYVQELLFFVNTWNSIGTGKIRVNKILAGNTSTECWTDFYPALQPTTHLRSSSSSFSCLEASLGSAQSSNSFF